MPSIEALGTHPFLSLGGGGLAIGHRPRLRALPGLAETGFTHVVSVLAEGEDPTAIRDAAGVAGLSWLWIRLGTTKTLPARNKPEIRRALEDLAAIAGGGGRIYLHCSAGIHRTGMIAAALLFHLGWHEPDIREALAALRSVTADSVGEERLKWASSFGRENRSPG